MDQCDCLMLAAGRSARMDSWKMMLPWGTSTIVEHSVRTALSVCGRVVLVAGFRAEELVECFRGWQRVEVVRNERYESGMLSSVQRGARAVQSAVFILALADMPGVPAEIYRHLLRWSERLCPHFSNAGEDFAVIPRYRGKKGHPLLLSAGIRARILDAEEGRTLRDVLAAVATLVVPVLEPGILSDVDTPADYSTLKPRDSGPRSGSDPR